MVIKILKFTVKFISLIPKRIVELIKTFGKVLAKAIAGEGVMAPKWKAQKRLKICRGCELMQEDGTCGVCTCYMIAKVKFKAAECPEGKW